MEKQRQPLNIINILVQIAILSLAISSCNYVRDSRLRPILADADTLLICDRDSEAYALLEPVRVGMFDVDDDTYALYCTLMLQAQDRCDVPLVDSLAISAWAYYKGNKADAYHAGLAHYYMGKVAAFSRNDNLSLQLLEEATELFKRTQSARYTFLSLDVAAYVMMQRCNDAAALTLLDEAMRYAMEANNATYISSTYLREACCYYSLNKIDTIYTIINQPSIIKNFDYYNLMSLYYDKKQDLDKALLYNDSLIIWDRMQQANDTASEYCNKAYLLYRIGRKDEAEKIAKSIATTLIYQDVEKYRLLTDISIDKHNVDDAHYYFKKFELASDSILHDNNRNEEENLNRNISEQKKFVEQQKQEKKLLYAELIGVVIISVLTVIILQILYKKRQVERERDFKNIILLLEQEKNRCSELESKIAAHESLEESPQEVSLRKVICNNICLDIENYQGSTKSIPKFVAQSICSVYRDFDKQLKNAFPFVDDNDIALCCMIRIGLKRQFIISIFCLSAEGIRSRQNRLKAKMQKHMKNESAEWKDIWRFVENAPPYSKYHA